MTERPPTPQDDGPLDLDARQDEVLRQLDELNARIEAVINEHSPQAEEAEAPKTLGGKKAA